MMASRKNVAVQITSSLAAQSYVLYNLENVKDGCSMSFSDQLFYHLREHRCHLFKDMQVNKVTVVNKLIVKVGL